MAYRKKFKKGTYSKKNGKKKGPSSRQRAAYWIGVGLSAGRDPNLRVDLLESAPLKKNIQAGYNADNYKDVGGSFRR